MGSVTELIRKPEFRLEAIDRIVVDHGRAHFQRSDDALADIPADLAIKGQEKPAGLPAYFRTEIVPDIRGREEQDEPFVRQRNLQFG